MKNALKNLAWITLGCVIYSFGFGAFISPNNLAPGGLTGIAVMLREFIPLGTGTLVLIMNIPLMLVGLWKFGRAFLAQTVYATVLSSAMIDAVTLLIAKTDGSLLLTDDLLLAALAGGAAVGLGMGIIFRFGGTTGGSDIVVKLVRLRFRHVKTGRLFMIFDAAVVTVSAFVFHNVDLALYAGISLIITSMILDAVLYGTDSARLVYIVSDRNEAIAARILGELDIGATYVRGVGAYSRADKNVLMVAVKKQVFPKLKTIVGEEDEDSFMIVSSASEIFGEGFKRHNSAEL